MAANYDLQYWKAVLGQSGYLVHLLRDNDLAFKIFGHLLKPRGNVHCVAQYSERNILAGTDVAYDYFSPMDTNAKSEGGNARLREALG